MGWTDFVNLSGFTLATILFVVSGIFLSWRCNWRLQFPPGPTGVPLLGYLPFLGKRLHEDLAKLAEKYGPIFSLNLAGNQCVVLCKYDVLHEALVKNADSFSGRAVSTLLRGLGATNGIILRDYGEAWKELRKFGITTLKGFGVGKRSMENRVNEEIRYLLDKIRTKNGEPFDIQGTLSAAVCNNICSILTGKRYEYEDEKFKMLLDLMRQRYGTKTAKQIKMIGRFPFLRHLPGYKGAYGLLIRQINYNKNMFDDVIDQHRKTFDPSDIRDFIDAFLKQIDDENKGHFTRETLHVVIRDLFFAGTDTTTTTLRWCLLYLASHVEFQHRLRKEIHSVCGDAGILSMDKKAEMPLMCSFLHEIHRVKPAGTLAPHKTTNSVRFREYVIPKNTDVIVNIWQVHHDSENFVHPFKFLPERFLDENGKFCKHDRVIPFSMGPRYCMGKHLAEMEAFLFLTGILRSFRIEEDPKFPLPSFEESVNGDIVFSPLPYQARFVPTL